MMAERPGHTHYRKSEIGRLMNRRGVLRFRLKTAVKPETRARIRGKLTAVEAELERVRAGGTV